mmetsp:Transcript_59845/g.142567  ORF Transcript_59845/g.142567 Transcript_59845/m.142567 type:complete len:124 (-) Transcript_59845:137-508(-)
MLNEPLLNNAANGDVPAAPARAGGVMRNLGLKKPPKATVRSAMVKMAPNAIYANERTLLDWLHFALMLAIAGIILMDAAESFLTLVTGRVMLAAAILLISWALKMYNFRATALNEKAITDYHL